MTPHINAQKNEFSDRVIMSGDPRRVQYIAKNFLKDITQVTNVRSMLGYTGYYKNILISVMSHGMGIPSAAIYTEELVKFYGVKKIIRIGTCGTTQENIFLKDILIAMGACTDSNFNRIKFNNYDFSAIANFELLYHLKKCAYNMDINVHIGNFFTTDIFYARNNLFIELLNRYKILGIDMETAGIYNVAAEYNIQALSVCTVSDHITLKQKLTSEEREHALTNIIKLALNTIIL
ncbi:purine-nucleoside phosphorylase [Buchnera aphidicola (Sarucallis kahawaluokalani)]|uniref:Purine nucleoside phosphorylase DeoD-type n=1 Tax=Buchnera aphidicola (Sarucallis kahawaluokalani) TaxID=1241878 RepID=A0A4D6YAQ7_9GAMM|nr:purine-nucleoside phosphorylase [Buchnera aphidicola (Sarucallis kahawaluokalani)]